MNKEYEELYGQLKAPEEWKVAIKEQMRQAVEQENKENKATVTSINKRKKNVFRAFYAVAGVAAAAMICIVVLPFGKKSSIYKVPMKEGTYYEEVLLKQGELHFNEKEKDLFGELGLTFGQGTGELKQEEKTTYDVGNGTVTVTLVEDVKMPEKKGNYSNINGTEMFITTETDQDEKNYKAEYVKDGNMITVEGNQVTQKEFVEFLYKEVMK